MELQKRKRSRLQSFDYSSCGAYFVTICTADRRKILSRIDRGDPCGRPNVTLSEIGEIVQRNIFEIENRYDFLVDHYVIMPDHVHLLLVRTDERATARVAPTVGQAVGALKSLSVRDWRVICSQRGQIMGKTWQRNYYEHIIRNDQDLAETRRYIEDNPIQWLEDRHG